MPQSLAAGFLLKTKSFCTLHAAAMVLIHPQPLRDKLSKARSNTTIPEVS